MASPHVYDSIGVHYSRHRRSDPRIARQVHRAVGSARTVVNVGAGTGSYEPEDRFVVPVEPSERMIAQRRDRRAVRAVAEALPFPHASFDVAMAILTVHHWRDQRVGLRELRRVADRCVVLAFDPNRQRYLWLARDYLPVLAAVEERRAPSIEMLAEALGADTVEVVPVPWDCTDGFQSAYWRRPELYLDPSVRAGISTFARADPAALGPGLDRLAADLESGRWREVNRDLLERSEMDCGYRLIVSRR